MPTQVTNSELVERARNAMRRREWLEAANYWEQVREHFPSLAPAYLGGGNALREAHCYDQAEQVLCAGTKRFPDNEQIAVSHAWVAIQRHDWQAAIDRWESLRKRFPANPWCHIGNVYALRGAGRSDQVDTLLADAEAALATAKLRGLEVPSGQNLEFAIARIRLDWPAVKKLAEEIIARETEPGAQVFLALSQAHWNFGNRDLADEAAERALAADPTLMDAWLVRAWVATERGDGDTAVACYRRLAQISPETVRWPLKLVQLLTWLGRGQEALIEFENIRQRWPNDPMARMFLRNYGPGLKEPLAPPHSVLAPGKGDLDRAEWEEIQTIAAKAPNSAERLRPLLVAEPERDVQIAPVANAKSAVLVFTGGNDAISMPLAVFDRYVSTLKITAVYLKDFRRLRYLLGVQSLGGDYEVTLKMLRDILGRVGAKHVSTFGNCEGGFAAIRYGVELGADRIVTFGAPTYSPDDSFTKIEQARNFMKNRLASSVNPEMMDLRPFLESRQHRAQIDFFYEEEDTRDSIHAAHLAGVTGVRFHPQPGLNHHMLRQLALVEDDFRGMLAELLAIEMTVRAE